MGAENHLQGSGSSLSKIGGKKEMSDTTMLFREVEQKIEYFSNAIASEISERSLFEKAALRLFLRPRLLMALNEIMELQANDLVLQRDGLVERYQECLRSRGRAEAWSIGKQIGDLNRKIKARNLMLNNISTGNLKQYVLERFGQDTIDDYVKWKDKKLKVITQ